MQPLQARAGLLIVTSGGFERRDLALNIFELALGFCGGFQGWLAG
jgi:hypothetical protein